MAKTPRPLMKRYCASIYPTDKRLPPRFCTLVKEVERIVELPIWLLIQNETPDDSYAEITSIVYKGFQKKVDGEDSGAAFLIESPGGNPTYAYRIGRLFQRRLGSYTAIVPQYAKSAATLLALGADQLILGRDSELGPLDLQVFDAHQEAYDSALNSVQALERLGAYALTAVDQTMQLLLRRVPKKTDVLVPMALDYVTKLLKPLLEKVDAVDYARKSRDLKVAEEYAARLMRSTHGFAKGREIARRLVQNYPAHGFVIDRDEIVSESTGDDSDNSFGLGIEATEAEQELQDILDEMLQYLDTLTVIGRLVEYPNV